MYEKVPAAGERIPELTWESSLKMVDDMWKDYFERAGLKYQSPAFAVVEGDEFFDYNLEDGTVRVSTELDRLISDEMKGLEKEKVQLVSNVARFVIIAHEMGHHTQKQLRFADIAISWKKEWEAQPLSEAKFRMRDIERHADYLVGFTLRKLLEQKRLSINVESLLLTLDFLSKLGKAKGERSSYYGFPEERREWIKTGFKAHTYFPAQDFPEMNGYAILFRKINAIS